MKKYSLLAVILFIGLITTQAAQLTGALRINTDTTGTNTKSSAITVTLQTNLLTGSVTISNVTASSIVKVDANQKTLAATAGTDYLTPTAGTIDFSTALVGKFKSYIVFLTPSFGEGVGAVPNTNDYTLATFGHYKFSGSAATNVNYVVYGPISVPTDLDTAVAMRARLKVRLSATETSASTFNIGVQDVADSASGSFAGAGNWAAVAIGADGSGAANDIETSAYITLTGWAAALTPDHSMFIVLNRDGSDTATSAIWDAELKIEYGVTQ